MISIRNFIPSNDYEEVVGWWHSAGMAAPELESMPRESTFLLENDGVPWLIATCILTNVKIAWIECFVGNPATPGPARRDATSVLLFHIEEFARSKGYRRVICMAPNERLNCYYQSLGFQETARFVFSLAKEL